MVDDRRTGAPGLSRTPKTPGKLPRVSVSLPDELKDIIEKEAGRRGITVSKYVADVLTHMHDSDGLNVPEPMPGGSVDLSPVLNAINVLASEVRGVKSDMQDMKSIVYALPAGSAAPISTKQTSLPVASDEKIPGNGPVFEEEKHYEAPERNVPAPAEVDHSDASGTGEAWIPAAELKKMFNPSMTSTSSTFSHLLAKLRTSGELIGREPKKQRWEYEPGSVKSLFERHPEFR